MRRILILFLLSTLLLGCSKEDEEVITTFRGIVLNQNTNEPLTDGLIQILGSEALERTFEESFQIENDGTFNIRLATTNVSIFQMNLASNDDRIIYVSCTGPSISQYCTLMAAGEDHSGITMYARTPIDD